MTKKNIASLDEQVEADLLMFFEVASRLSKAGVFQSSNFLGDIGEYLCAHRFGTVLHKSRRQDGEDGLEDGGVRVQIKFHNSPKGTNISAGDPDKYDVLRVVVGPHSRLRGPEQASSEFCIYSFTSAEVKMWDRQEGSRGQYLAKDRLGHCNQKEYLQLQADLANLWLSIDLPRIP